MMRTTPRPRSNTDERGAVLVELAIVIAPLVLIALGLLEMGVAWRSSLDIEQASRAGARTSAALADDSQADREALRAIEAGLDSTDVANLERIIIFDANANDEPPASCLTASSKVCNSYEPAALTRLDDDSAWGCGAGSLDGAWCPTARMSYLRAPVHVGVRVITRHDWVTGIFPGTGLEVEGTTIMRLPPLLR